MAVMPVPVMRPCSHEGCREVAWTVMAGICPQMHVSMYPLCGAHLEPWRRFLDGHQGSWVCGCGSRIAEIMTEDY